MHASNSIVTSAKVNVLHGKDRGVLVQLLCLALMIVPTIGLVEEMYHKQTCSKVFDARHKDCGAVLVRLSDLIKKDSVNWLSLCHYKFEWAGKGPDPRLVSLLHALTKDIAVVPDQITINSKFELVEPWLHWAGGFSDGQLSSYKFGDFYNNPKHATGPKEPHTYEQPDSKLKFWKTLVDAILAETARAQAAVVNGDLQLVELSAAANAAANKRRATLASARQALSADGSKHNFKPRKTESIE